MGGFYQTSHTETVNPLYSRHLLYEGRCHIYYLEWATVINNKNVYSKFFGMLGSTKSTINERLLYFFIFYLSGNTIIDAWIQAAGGVNAAVEVDGSFKEVSMEQILKWNPDVIILGTGNTGLGAKNADLLKTDPQWQKINAVKNGRVYVNPNGAFMWDRYGAEEALEIQWAAKTLNPDKFTNLDMNQVTKDFYKTFLNYNLTEDETNRILTGKNPAQ